MARSTFVIYGIEQAAGQKKEILTMSFPDPTKFRLVVAGPDASGQPEFLEVGPAAEIHIPGIADGAFYWEVKGGHSATNFGAVPGQVALAGTNGSTFGVNSFPAHSEADVEGQDFGDTMSATGDDGDAGMHASPTIDYEVVISGKVDVILPGGKKRTLVPGDLLVMAGVPHAWKNPYDEDCVYIVVTIGYNDKGAL